MREKRFELVGTVEMRWIGKAEGSLAKRKLSETAGGIPVGLSIVLYLVSNVRNTLVILTGAPR